MKTNYLLRELQRYERLIFNGFFNEEKPVEEGKRLREQWIERWGIEPERVENEISTSY